MRARYLTMTTAAAGLLASASAVASSHSDAPRIKQDPQANLTDVYAFIGTRYDDPSQRVLNVLVNVRPFSEPGDGVIYDRFADDARYSIHIADPTSGAEVLRYDFEFSAVDSGYKNLGTILAYGLGTEAGPIVSVGDARQNYTQTYQVTRWLSGNANTVGANLPTPPPNVGKNVTPDYNDANGIARQGAATTADLDSYTSSTLAALDTNEVAWAGPREDSFFADTPGIFDLLSVRILDNNGSLADGLGQDGAGVDGFKGYNVLSFGLQIPLANLPSLPYTSAFFGPQSGVGVYASVSRRMTRTLSAAGPSYSGPWVQVNRLGNPLFNEVLVALADKDAYNRSAPTGDAAAFATYAENPEVAFLVNFVYGTSFQETMRADLVNVFIPDVLRVDTTTDPVPLSGSPGFSRLGFIGGDTTSGISSGWPNGRRLGDDVVDIALTAVASGPSYSAITVVGDNVAGNDVPYHRVFPYLGTPHAGPNNYKDSHPGDLNGDGTVNLTDLAGLLNNFGVTFP